jgi:putative hydrolase of the HAD superfamily
MKPRVDALVFDLGGVLIDVSFDRAIAAWAAAAGVSAGMLAPRFRLDDVFHAHERGEIDDAGYFAALRQAFGISLDDEAMRAGWNAVIGEPIPGMEALLGRLSASLPLYVFSNTNPAHAAHFTPRHRALLAPVKRVICSCDLGLRKPDPAAFAKVALVVGAAPERVGFFDDNAENVAAARAAGFQAFRVTSTEEVTRALPGLGIVL